MPLASNVNYFGGDVVSNAVAAQIGEDGKVCIYTLEETDLIVDANGQVPSPGSPQPVVPARLLETRDEPGFTTVDDLRVAEGRVPADSEIELEVAGRGDVAADADAVIMNVGAIFPSADGFLTVYPCGEDRPLASSLNYAANAPAVSNAVFTQIGDDGKVCIYSLAETDMIVDVNAFNPAGAQPMPVGPARLLETRDVPGFDTIDGMNQGEGPVPPDSSYALDVQGRGGVPDDAETVILSVAAVDPVAEGFLTVYPCGEDAPQASNINHIPNDVVANMVVAKVGDDGQVCIYSLVETDLIVDVVAASSPVVPVRPGDPT